VEIEKLQELYIEPATFLLLSLVLCVLCAMFLVHRFDLSDDVSTFTMDMNKASSIQIAEAADAVLDLIVWWVTWASGDFNFSNDPNLLLEKAAFVVAVFSMAAFVSEVALGSCYCKSGQLYARYLIGVHVVMEDLFQMLLYTLVSACQIEGSVSMSAGFGVLQCIVFFLFKTGEVFKLKGGQPAGPKRPRPKRAGPTSMI